MTTTPQKPSTPTNRSQSSPAKFKEHYSHLTYSSRRTKEGEEETSSSTPLGTPKGNNKAFKASFSAGGGSSSLDHLKLPPLKLISGFSISEDGYMMSRFVSPPRFGLNNFEEAVSASSGGNQQHHLPINANSNYSPSNNNNRVFTATVSRDANGNARISIPRTTGGGGGGVATTRNQQQQQQQVETSLLEQTNDDPWLALLKAAETEGLYEVDLALLDRNTIKELLVQFHLSKSIIENPVLKAKCELMWRKAHDKVLLERLQQNEQQQQQSKKSSTVPLSIFALSEGEQQQLEFKNFVEHLYPPSPIMQAAGGPVILVRTAPQGEILVNPSGGNEFSPRLKNQDFYTSSTFEALLAETGGENTFVQARHIPDEKRLFGAKTFGKNPESSPLKNPALVKQVPKQTLGKRNVL